MSSKYVMSEEEKKALQFAKIKSPKKDMARLYCRIGEKCFYMVWCSAQHGFVGPQRFVALKNGKFWWIDDDEEYVMRKFINEMEKGEKGTGLH